MALDIRSSRGVARWAVLAVVVVAAVAGTVVWARSGAERTDDAQIEGRITPIVARVGGTVQKAVRGGFDAAGYARGQLAADAAALTSGRLTD